MGFAAKELLLAYSLLSSPRPPYPPPIPLLPGSVSVCFTPSKTCRLQILHHIAQAKESIYLQAYSFSDSEIAHALVHAAQRGVKVKVLLDKSNRTDKSGAKDLLLQNQVPLRFDAPAGIAHNKIIILDDQTTITGSYNFSAAAYARNAENLLIIKNPPLAQKYIDNWRKRWDISQPLR